MKKLNFDNMETLQGGVTNRDCMIAGGVTLLAIVTGNIGNACAIVAGAAYFGCFH